MCLDLDVLRPAPERQVLRCRWSCEGVENKTRPKHMVFSAYASQCHTSSLQVVCAQHSHRRLHTHEVHDLSAMSCPGTSRSWVADFHFSTLYCALAQSKLS